MSHKYTPSDLHNSEEFELYEVVEYENIKNFIMKTIQKQPRWLKIYGIIQLIAVFMLVGILSFLITVSIGGNGLGESLKWFLIGIAFSITLLIPIHELLHALAFLLLGKRDIGFGMQLRKFIFYAEANMQVLNGKEISIVALTPFAVVFVIALSAVLMLIGHAASLFFLAIFLLHFMFCAGDMAIVSLFRSRRGLYSYDSRSEKRSYYFVKKDEL